MGAAGSLALQGFGVGASTVGAYYSSAASQNALRTEANIADTQARLSEMTAQTSLSKGQREEQRSRLQTSNIKGKQRTAFAANGIDLGSDSAVNVMTSTDVMGEIDANVIAANAAREAWGYRAQAVNFQNEASTKRATAGAINPWMSATTSFLTGASKVATSYYKMQREGVVPKNKTSNLWGDW